MSMYCIQVNKLLQLLKNDKKFSKQDLYVVLTYEKQRRRTTCKMLNNNNHIWYESFLFVIDNDLNKNIKIEVFDKNNRKNGPLITEKMDINRNRMCKKNTKFLEVQHGLINYDFEVKVHNLTIENLTLRQRIDELECENLSINEKLNDESGKLKQVLKNIKELVKSF